MLQVNGKAYIPTFIRLKMNYNFALNTGLLACCLVLGISVSAVGQKRQSAKSEFKALANKAEQGLARGIEFYHSIAINGGYVYYYTLDLQKKWGEGPTDDQTVEVQPPGTPAVGMAFLEAYHTLRRPEFLEAAKDAANALILGQNHLGGWTHTISFDRPKSQKVSFDDNQTQGAIRFLMALDQDIDDPVLTLAIDRALEMMLRSQLDHGGWPHQYPEQGNYHDFATFNDGGINDCILVMTDALKYYGADRYWESLQKAGRFLLISQLPPPQSGWAQQYNAYLQPAWARAFEPPSVCTLVTWRNINSLMDLAVFTKNARYLEPIPDALHWLERTRLGNGMWPRFVALNTNEPLYYDRGRIRVDSPEQLSLERRTGYGYQVDLYERLQESKARYDALIAEGIQKFVENKDDTMKSAAQIYEELEHLSEKVEDILASQDKQGRWITRDDRYKKRVAGRLWDGQYEVNDRLSSAVFIENVQALCQFLNAYYRLD